MVKKSADEQIVEKIFFDKYSKGIREIDFERLDTPNAATSLGISLPKNLGDLIYSIRYLSLVT